MRAPTLHPGQLVPCLVALVSAACASVPPPAILIEPGVKAAAVDVQRDVVADFGPEDGTQRVMDLGWDPDTDDLRIITEWGVRWIDLADGSHRDVAFMQHMFRATPVLTSAGPRVVGLSGSRDVPVLRLDGSRDVVLRGERYELPIAGDVASAAGSEILLPYRDGVRVYSGAGEMLRFVRGLEYTSDYTFVQADRDGELEIVLMRPMRGAMEVRVVNFDGSVAYDWRRSEGTWLSWIPPLGSDLLWGVTSAGFVAFGPGGRQVHAYPAEGVSYLRDVAGARVGEFVALVASGNGYRGRSMLTIYDRYAELVYQEIFTGRVYTVASHPTEPVLFVGAHERVLRYRIRSEPGVVLPVNHVCGIDRRGPNNGARCSVTHSRHGAWLSAGLGSHASATLQGSRDVSARSR